MTLKATLDALFQADREAHAAERRLLEDTDSPLLPELLTAEVDSALALEDRQEGQIRLSRLADLCAQVQGDAMADALIRILNCEEAHVRVAAGEALRDFAFDRYAEVARAVERAVTTDLVRALQEIPWVLAEVGEPSAVPLIARFLKHSDVNVVASAIEALAELGEPDAASYLKTLEGDTRIARLEEGDASYSATLGELASEAITSIE